MVELAECLVVDHAVIARFGKTREELAAMTLRQFFEMAQSQGYDIHVGPFTKTPDGGHGQLRVMMTDDLQQPLPR